MGKATTKVAIDTYVNSARPKNNYQEANRLGVKGTEQYAYVYFSRPFPLGASIISAKLKIQTYEMTGTGTRSMKVNRTSSRTTLSKLNFDNKPTVYEANAKTVSKTGALPGGTEWSFDISAMMQQVSDGAQWYGVRISTPENAQRWIYGSETDRGPVLEIEWSDAPSQPDGLVPSGAMAVGTNKPVLRFDYVDITGKDDLEAIQVQISNTASFASPVFDSGEYPTTEPELDLAETEYAGMSTSTNPYWRVRAKDGSGLWSEWSDQAQMRYVPRPTVTIISPTDKFYDPTQTIKWSLSSGTQSAYQVIVAPANNPGFVLWNSGKVTSKEDSLTLPRGTVRFDNRTYRITVRLWDSTKRVSTPGSPAYGQAGVDSYYDEDATTPGVTSITATANTPKPSVTLRWEYGSLPDGWLVSRNGEIVAHLDSEDVPLFGGKYVWTDRVAIPQVENTYTVRPVVNGKAAYGNKSAKVTLKPFGIWLMSGSDEIVLMGNDSGTWEMGGNFTAHEVLGSSRVAVVTQGLRGYEGDITGLLVSGVIDKSAQEMRDTLMKFKSEAAKGKTFRLVVSDMNIPVKIANVVPRPTPEAELTFEASFSFWQAGELGFDTA